MNKARLLMVARALENSPAPEAFCTANYSRMVDGKLVPCCPLGTYVMSDLQNTFVMRGINDIRDSAGGESVEWDDPLILKHFDISDGQASVLFDANGCGGANTALQAALFIRGFVDLYKNM